MTTEKFVEGVVLTDFTWRFDWHEVGFKPYGINAAIYINQNKYCNFTGWRPNIYTAAPNACGNTTKYCRAQYRLVGTALYGVIYDPATGSGDTPATRPTGLMTNPAYIRQMDLNNIIPNPQVSGSLRPQ